MTYAIGEGIFEEGTAAFERALATAHPAKVRPFCLCRIPGVAMHIAKANGSFFVRKNPYTGPEHSPSCGSFEPPAELSGLGQVLGSAITEDEAGQTVLKVDFALRKTPGRASPTPSGIESDSVKSDASKLTLRSVLHYLWMEAGLNAWKPAWQGRRSWGTVRKLILQASQDKSTKGLALGDILFVPEPFYLDQKEAIASRRIAQMIKGSQQEGSGRQLMLVVGEIKELAPARYGQKIVFKHLPDCHFMLSEDLKPRLAKRFSSEFGLWDAYDGSHLMAVATFGTNPGSGVPAVEEIAVMVTNENWIPYENAFEKVLLDSMTMAGREFTKGMRMNLPSGKPLASLTATDTGELPTAMYVLPASASEESGQELQRMIDESRLLSWLWRPGEGGMPALPPSVGSSG